MCVNVKLCVCVFFNLGCSNAELLSLHRSSPHTWCFWGCRWRLSTSISLYLTHPLRLNFCSLRSLFVLFRATHLFLYFVNLFFFSCPLASCCFFFLFLNILFQDVEPASGIACFRPFSCQLTTILPVSPASICSFYLALSLLCGDTQRVLLCFMSIIHSPTSGTCNVP